MDKLNRLSGQRVDRSSSSDSHKFSINLKLFQNSLTKLHTKYGGFGKWPCLPCSSGAFWRHQHTAILCMLTTFLFSFRALCVGSWDTDAYARIGPQRKVLAECGFSPLHSKKSQMKKVFLSSTKGKQPSNKSPNAKFLLALKDKVVSPSE